MLFSCHKHQTFIIKLIYYFKFYLIILIKQNITAASFDPSFSTKADINQSLQAIFVGDMVLFVDNILNILLHTENHKLFT